MGTHEVGQAGLADSLMAAMVFLLVAGLELHF